MKIRLVVFTLLFVIALSLILPGIYGTAFTAQAARSCFPPPKGLTNWWPGDGNTDDIIGAQNAVLVNDAEFGTGIVDQAFSLDGDRETLSKSRMMPRSTWALATSQSTSGSTSTI